jgi:hypothetical protein
MSIHVLVGQTGKKTFVDILKENGWGRMWTTHPPNPFSGEKWGFDNCAYSYWSNGLDFDEDAFRKRMDRAYHKGPPYLAVVPDIVAGGVLSLEYSESWRTKLPTEWPWFLAVQDGMCVADVQPLVGHYAGLFLGGTNTFKATAKDWCDLAHDHGLLFHYGRAGVPHKIEHAKSVGSDSLDSSFPLWTEERFKWFVEIVKNGHPQMDMMGRP